MRTEIDFIGPPMKESDMKRFDQLVQTQAEYECMAVDNIESGHMEVAQLYLGLSRLYMDKVSAFIMMHNTRMWGKERFILEE